MALLSACTADTGADSVGSPAGTDERAAGSESPTPSTSATTTDETGAAAATPSPAQTTTLVGAAPTSGVATVEATTTQDPTSTTSPATGSARECSDGLQLEDTDGDGWGECAPPELDFATVIWWHRIGEFRQPLCNGGYDAASEASLVPGGLDRETYDFFCATLASDNPPAAPTP